MTVRALGRALCQRCVGTPLQHITGEQPFLDLTLAVEPGVFLPRPETELLAVTAVEALDGIPSPVVVDVGTGTGAIALAVSSRRRDARVIATDVSPAAVRLATSNADRLGHFVDVREGDLLEPVPPELRGAIDLVVSNPPYIDVGDYEDLPLEVRADPPEALIGGTEFHRRLCDDAPSWLRRGGWLIVEIGDDQGADVRVMFERWADDVAVLPDLAGRDRIVRGRLGGSPPVAGGGS